MSDVLKLVELVCPRCGKKETTCLDADEPQEASVVELACAACVDVDDSHSVEPMFKDARGGLLL